MCLIAWNDRATALLCGAKLFNERIESATLRHRQTTPAMVLRIRIAKLIGELEALREWLAPTTYVGALWAIGYLIAIAGWSVWSSHRLRAMLERIRTEDHALWQEFGRPEQGSDFGSAGNWPIFRRIRKDRAFAERFNQRVVLDLRNMQRSFSAGLVVMAVVGLGVLFLVWPHL